MIKKKYICVCIMRKISAKGSVLEVGAGTLLNLRMGLYTSSVTDVTALDISKAMLLEGSKAIIDSEQKISSQYSIVVSDVEKLSNRFKEGIQSNFRNFYFTSLPRCTYVCTI